MANVIKVVNQLGGQQVVNSTPLTLPVKSGTTASIQPGYLVIKDGSNDGYWKAAADACDTDTAIKMGIARSASTETASADGTVEIDTAPFLYVKMKAKTPGSLASTMRGDSFILDVTSGNYTLDQGTTTKGFLALVNYDNTTDGNCDVIIPTFWNVG